jgi:hypothetical protein
MSQCLLIIGPLIIVRNKIYNVFQKECARSRYLYLALKQRNISSQDGACAEVCYALDVDPDGNSAHGSCTSFGHA